MRMPGIDHIPAAGQENIVPTDVVVVGDKQITCTIVIPQSAETGTWSVTVTYPDGQSGTKMNCYMVKTKMSRNRPLWKNHDQFLKTGTGM